MKNTKLPGFLAILLLDEKGDVVRTDAISCQKEIAKKVREKGADLCLR